AARERGGEPARTLVDVMPGAPQVAMDDGDAIGIHRRRLREEGHRRERRVVRLVAVEVALVDRCHVFLRSAAFTVFASSIAIVIGPTPPGTGVMRDAIGTTASKSTSPTSLPSGRRFTPTSMTT